MSPFLHCFQLARTFIILLQVESIQHIRKASWKDAIRKNKLSTFQPFFKVSSRTWTNQSFNNKRHEEAGWISSRGWFAVCAWKKLGKGFLHRHLSKLIKWTYFSSPLKWRTTPIPKLWMIPTCSEIPFKLPKTSLTGGTSCTVGCSLFQRKPTAASDRSSQGCTILRNDSGLFLP